MTRFSFHTIGFDLDGTLLDTAGDLAAAVNHGLARLDLPPLDVERVRPLIGGGARQMLANAVAAQGATRDEAAIDAAHAGLRDFYAANLTGLTRPFPGTIEALDALAAAGATLAVVTNKLERFSVQLLDATGLLPRFAAVIGGDTLPRGKPHPDPLLHMVQRCGGPAAYVGDSRFDVEAARAAGLPVVACAWGYRDGPVDVLGADAVIDRFDQLLPALERLG